MGNGRRDVSPSSQRERETEREERGFKGEVIKRGSVTGNGRRDVSCCVKIQ